MTHPMSRSFPRLALAAFGLLAIAGVAPEAQGEEVQRFTADTPDAIVAAAKARGTAAKNDGPVMSSLATIAEMADLATEGTAADAYDAIGKSSNAPAEIRGEAAVFARALANDEGTRSGIAKAKALGIVTDLAVLGPFRDTGGGLETKDGPESKKDGLGDMAATYAWGTVEVGWRKVPAEYAQARGVPLDLMIHPRRESCSWVASKIKLSSAQTIIVRLAAGGAARLTFDGAFAGKSDEAHAKARFERLAAQVDATAGAHVIAAKVCTSALEDSGRVRLRITDAKHQPLALETSADLSGDTKWGAAKPKATPTTLARVIGPKSDTLDGAIVRVFGGTDDQKSPRAPGQIDAFLQSQTRTADEVAMAAWATPSGANRSARYYRAQALAKKSGDEKTIAFVDRRLIDIHLDNDQADWAIAQLRGTKLDQQKDPEALLLQARTYRGLRVDALSVMAFRDLSAAFKASPGKIPTAILMELSTLARTHDVATWVTVIDELARRGVRGDILVDAQGTKGKEAVVKAATDAFAGGMDDADEALSVVRRVVGAGAHDVAAQLYRQVIGFAPNRSEGWSGFARELATQKGEEQKVLLALRRARELAPGDAKVRAELAMRSGANAKAQPLSDEHDDEKYIAKSEVLLARRQGVPQKGVPDVADRTLHWLRAVKMHPDNRVSQLIHYAREIVIAPRTQGELFEPIPPEGDLIEILRARVHRKNGGVAFPVEEHNDGQRPRIRWPELEPGDTVEVAVREWTSTAVGGRGDAPFYFRDYAGAPASHPLLYNEVIVESSPGHMLYVDVVHPELAPFKKTERDENGRHILQYVWDKPALIAEEPLAPNMSEISPVIAGSTFKSWADFRKWYAEAVRGFTEPDDEVRRIAADLTKGKNTREEKLRALFDFVSDDIRYVNYVSGEWWLPNRPQQLLQRREGDCDDKAMLLITLLRSVGIEAQEVMVQTRMTGEPSWLLAKNVAIPMFDHGIAFLPGPNGGQYLDATSPQSRLGPIPSMDARAVALRMDAGPAEIVQLPASSPDDHGSDTNWTLTLTADGSGELSGEEKHSGDSAFWLRSNLREAEARPQYVEDSLVGPWFPTVEVDKKIDFKGDLEGGKALVSYKAKSKGLARRENKELVLPLSPSNTFGSSLAPLPTRTLPVQLPPHLAPSHQNRTMRVIAPPGFSWSDNLPPGGDANGGDFGRAHMEIARDAKDPRVLVIKRSIVFNQHLIGVDKYPAWRTWITQVDSLMHKEVRLVGGEK